MKLLLRCLIFGLLSLGLAAAASADEYSDLVAQLKQKKTDIDYTKLRMAYTKSSGYDPYNKKTQGLLKQMLANPVCPDALDIAKQIEDIEYISIDSHMMASFCALQFGDKSEEVFHRAIASGLINSLRGGLDGSSHAKAYIVVTLQEEYNVLRGLGLKMRKQSSITENGHHYDRLEAADRSGKAQVLFFNIDLPYNALEHKIETERASAPKQ